MDFLKSLHATAVNQIKSILNRYTRRVAMGPAELEFFSRECLPFGFPKFLELISEVDFWFRSIKHIYSKLHPAPHEVLILLVLLASWMEDPPEVQSEYDVLEFFAGVGRIARLSEKVGMNPGAPICLI